MGTTATSRARCSKERRFQRPAYLVIALTALLRQHVLVERAEEHQDAIAAPLENIDRPLEEAPLE